MSVRYTASDEVEHGCCYGASVIDTDNDQIVVECADEEIAKRIADMLNGTEA